MEREDLRISVVVYLPRYGGASKHAMDIASGLKTKGHDIAIVSWEKPAEIFEKWTKFEEWFTPAFCFPPKGKLFQMRFGLQWALNKCIKNFKPNAVIIADAEPVVGMDVPSKIPVICHVNFPPEMRMFRGTLLHTLYRSFYWWQHYKALQRLDAVTCVSKFILWTTWTAWQWAVSQEKFHVIYPCVDLTWFQKELPRQRKIAYVGRIDKRKGIDFVIDAFLRAKKEVPDGNLEIAGAVSSHIFSDKYYPILKDRIDKTNGISLKRDVSYQTIVDTLLSSRAFAFYNPFEHFGIVNIEAMAAGTPPIAARGGGNLETVIDGKTGFLVETKDEMADRMVQLLTNNKLFRRMSGACRSRAEKFSEESMINLWERLLQKCVERSSKTSCNGQRKPLLTE